LPREVEKEKVTELCKELNLPHFDASAKTGDGVK